MEIEKKYLLNGLPFDLSAYPAQSITQGYIAVSPTIRLRQINDYFVLTVKGPGHMAREELELPLTHAQFQTLWQKVDVSLQKTRYLVPLSESLTAEVDVYAGSLSGLYTVEVEFTSIEAANGFTPPAWFGPDVTLDKRYKNTALAMYGLPEPLREE